MDTYMPTIETKLLPATGTRGYRVKAQIIDGQSVTIDHNHGLTTEQNHRAAAENLVKKLSWSPVLEAGGHTKTGMVFILDV